MPITQNHNKRYDWMFTFILKVKQIIKYESYKNYKKNIYKSDWIQIDI